MGKFYVNTFLDFNNKEMYSKSDKISKFFSFFGVILGSTNIENITLHVDTIIKLGYTNTRQLNKKGSFIGFKRQGLIIVKNVTYFTDVKYIDDLRRYYFKGRIREISREKIMDRTQAGVIKFKYNVEYEII